VKAPDTVENVIDPVATDPPMDNGPVMETFERNAADPTVENELRTSNVD
jgi:hypothetical protein